MTASQELTNLVLQGQNGETLSNMAAFLFEIICKEHKFQTEKPRWRRAVHGEPHYWGSSIFGPVLQEAGLIRVQNGRYVPTERGLEIYERLKSEGFYNSH